MFAVLPRAMIWLGKIVIRENKHTLEREYVEKQVRNTPNLLDQHRELFGAGQLLWRLKIWGSKMARDCRRSRRSESLWLQKIIKTVHMGRNVGLFGTLQSQKDKLTNQ